MRNTEHPVFKKVVFLDETSAFNPISRDERRSWWRSGAAEAAVKEVSENVFKKRSEFGEGLKLSKYDFLAIAERRGHLMYAMTDVWSQWNFDAVERLKKVLDEADAGIVLTSPMRETYCRMQIQAFFVRYDLDGRVFDMTPSPNPLIDPRAPVKHSESVLGNDRERFAVYASAMRSVWQALRAEARRDVQHRTAEIREYLDRHQEIESFAVVDGMDLSAGLPRGRQVRVDKILDGAGARKIRSILAKPCQAPQLPDAAKGGDFDAFRNDVLPVVYRRWRDPVYAGLDANN